MTSAASPAPAVVAPKRYHPAQVTLHWLIAILVFITPLLLAGGEGRRRAASIGGIPTIGFHMIFGLAVLALLIIRLVVRYAIRRPQWATAGNAFFDFVGRWTHIGLYFFTFAVTITGLIFAVQTNRLGAVFWGCHVRTGRAGYPPARSAAAPRLPAGRRGGRAGRLPWRRPRRGRLPVPRLP